MHTIDAAEHSHNLAVLSATTPALTLLFRYRSFRIVKPGNPFYSYAHRECIAYFLVTLWLSRLFQVVYNEWQCAGGFASTASYRPQEDFAGYEHHRYVILAVKRLPLVKKGLFMKLD